MAASKRKSIPSKVKLTLREEVGFGCPVKNCGNPYLEYHHFDPPVNIRSHNEPEGMIALCAQHHKKADGDAYTVEQLHTLKKDKANADIVKGNLDWLRQDLLAVIGGVFYFETPTPVLIDNQEVISIKRDEEGYLRLSINMLSIQPEERLIIDSNSWENIGNPIDLRCPPQGKELEVKYANGDQLYLHFFVIKSAKEANEKYNSNIFASHSDIVFPITVVEINMSIGGTSINFSPLETTFSTNTIKGCMMSKCSVGLSLNNTGIDWLQNPKWKFQSKFDYVDGSNIINVKFGS
ncbi:MAG: HNH endonuclease [Gammaproteobacteria bacterium]|nr:MAG: HNH endonuclease [Gammaproteobacteria bacterium]PHR84566.1 MAG: HNH endonuclease [Colwellia sp.]